MNSKRNKESSTVHLNEIAFVILRSTTNRKIHKIHRHRTIKSETRLSFSAKNRTDVNKNNK